MSARDPAKKETANSDFELFTLEQADAERINQAGFALQNATDEEVKHAASEALNSIWAQLGEEKGFVWTTVTDLVLHREGGGVAVQGATFKAWPAYNGREGDPAFEDWFAQTFTGSMAPINFDKEELQQAFEAGRQHNLKLLGVGGERVEVVAKVALPAEALALLENTTAVFEAIVPVLAAALPFSQYINRFEEMHGKKFEDITLGAIRLGNGEMVQINMTTLRSLRDAIFAMPEVDIDAAFGNPSDLTDAITMLIGKGYDEEGNYLYGDSEELDGLIERHRERDGDKAHSDWAWWARANEGEAYTIEAGSKVAVIAMARTEWGDDASVERFEIIEARSWDDEIQGAIIDHVDDEIVPFSQTRNHEWIDNTIKGVE